MRRDGKIGENLSLLPKISSCTIYSLVPRPHPKKGERGLVNLDRFLGLTGSVGARRHCSRGTNLGSVIGHGRGCVQANDSNLYSGRQWHFAFLRLASHMTTLKLQSHWSTYSFPWPKDCVQIHQISFPFSRMGSGNETKPSIKFWEQST